MGKLDKANAIRLMTERGMVRPLTAKATVELWLAWPLKKMGIK